MRKDYNCMRYLGIDFGEKRIGLALSDEKGIFSFPHAVLVNDSKTLEIMSNICKKEKVGKIIMGASLDYKGKANPVMRLAKNFAVRLEKETGLPVEYENEVLTTKEASNLDDDKSVRDAVAASVILRSYIARTNNRSF